MIRIVAVCLLVLTSGCSAIVRHDYFRPENERARYIEGDCRSFLGGPYMGVNKQFAGAPPISILAIEGATLGFCSHLERERIVSVGTLFPGQPFTFGAGPAEPRVEVAVRVVTSYAPVTLDLSSARLFTAAGEPRDFLQHSTSFRGCAARQSTFEAVSEEMRRVTLRTGQFVWLCFVRSEPTRDDEYLLHIESIAVGGVAQSPIRMRLRKVRGTFYTIIR